MERAFRREKQRGGHTVNCPECKSTSLQSCGFEIEAGKPGIAHYICLDCYCAFGGSFMRSGTTDEEDIL